MAKKFFMLGMLTIMALSLVACENKIPYNAVLYSNIKEWMNEEFLKENLTRGCYYFNDEGEVVTIANSKSYPIAVTKIVKNTADFDEIFSEFQPDVDFAKEMLLVYVFTAPTGIQPYRIANIALDDVVIKIQYKLEKSPANSGTASVPLQRVLVVKMDNLSIEAAEFTKE